MLESYKTPSQKYQEKKTKKKRSCLTRNKKNKLRNNPQSRQKTNKKTKYLSYKKMLKMNKRKRNQTEKIKIKNKQTKNKSKKKQKTIWLQHKEIEMVCLSGQRFLQSVLSKLTLGSYLRIFNHMDYSVVFFGIIEQVLANHFKF